MSEKKKKKKGGAGYIIGIIVCLCVAVVAGYKLVTTLNEYRKGTEEYDELRNFTDETAGEDATSDSGTDSQSGDSGTSVPSCPITVDFDSLKSINSDVVGWIYIGAVDISYPIAHGEDDNYYLHRTFKKQKNFAGSIFLEAKNKTDFSDPNSIVYGHNMRNGSMFGKLKKLLNDGAYQNDPYFWILTPNGNYCYKMFSIKKASVKSDVYTLFSNSDDEFVEYANKMQEESSVSLEHVNFTKDSKIVTLSTCTGDSSKRFVVQGVRIN